MCFPSEKGDRLLGLSFLLDSKLKTNRSWAICQGIREDSHKSMGSYSVSSGSRIYDQKPWLPHGSTFRFCLSAPIQPWRNYLSTIAPVPCLSAHFKKAEKVAYLMRCSCSWMSRVGLLRVKNRQHSALGGQEDLGRYTEGGLPSEGFSCLYRIRRYLSPHKGCICVRNSYWLYCTFFFPE